MIPNTLSIAGVDPSGGAGILADIKAMSAMGAYGMAVVTALTAQNTRAVTDILPIAPAFIGRQLDTLFDDVRVDAVKIGMLGGSDIIEQVSERLAHWQPPHIVLDPVMVAKSGAHLLEDKAVATLREALLPLAQIITPNLPETGVLLQASPPDSLRDMRRAAERLRRLLSDDDGHWVLLKGGHLPGNDTTDILHDGDRMIELHGQRIHTKNTHGTGCTLSAAIAALLPRKPDMEQAVRDAKTYLEQAIRASAALQVGSGHGPVDHFHAWRNASEGSADPNRALS